MKRNLLELAKECHSEARAKVDESIEGEVFAFRAQMILDESISYWHDMAEKTGTLWEFSAPTASCCHGYASHVVHVLYRDILGIYAVDTEEKVVRLRFCILRLDACEGSRPVPGGRVSLSWWKEDNHIAYRWSAPPGYRIEIENQSGRELVEQ